MSQPLGNLLRAVLFTDIVGSVELKQRLGGVKYIQLLARHDALFRQSLQEVAGGELVQDTGDGFLAVFENVTDAVATALRFQSMLRRDHPELHVIRVRSGVHLGEVVRLADKKMVGLAADQAARLMSLAEGGQILLSRPAFDNARQYLRALPLPAGSDAPAELVWVAHGRYWFKGTEEPLEVFEVGEAGRAPLVAPRDSEKAKRSVTPPEEETLGWRPAVGLAVPGRTEWRLERQLGEGGFGEVWLAKHGSMSRHRVFKFCFEAERLRSFKREMTLFRLLHEALGDRKDIAQIFEVKLDEPPYFIESEFTEEGSLPDWAQRTGGIERLHLEDRVDLAARVVEAVAAAHSVGVLHKDIKPSNILMFYEDGKARPRLADFGIGMLVDRQSADRHRVNVTGFTETLIEGNESSRTGTRMYAPPELLSGEPFTVRGDIYALGVLLFQLVVGDLTRPLAPGWERSVADELLREDIAASVEGDPQLRLDSAAELARRLRALPARRAELHARRRAAQVARRWQQAAKTAVALTVLGAALTGLAAYAWVRERQLRGVAENARAVATAAERQARTSETEAVDFRRKAEHARDLARRQLARRLLERAHKASAAYATMMRDLQAGPVDRTKAARLAEAYGFAPPALAVLAADSPYTSVAITPDGRRVAAGARDGGVTLWDVPAQQVVRRWTAHTAPVERLLLSPDGKVLVTSGGSKRTALGPVEDATIKLWDVATGGLLRELAAPDPRRGHRSSSLAIARDGRTVASVSHWQEEMVVWSVDTKDPIWSSRAFGAPPSKVAFSPDGHRLLVSAEGSLQCLDFSSRRLLWEQAVHTEPIHAIAVSADGTAALTASRDHTVRKWSMESGASEIAADHGVSVACTAFVDASTFISIDDHGRVELWNNDNSAHLRTVQCDASQIDDASFAADGGLIAVVSEGRIRVSSLRQPRHGAYMSVPGESATALAIAPDGRVALIGSSEGSLSLVDLATGKSLHKSPPTQSRVQAIVFAVDGSRAMCAWADRQIRVFEVPEMRVAQRAAHPDEKVDSVAISDDGDVAASQSQGRVVLWELKSGRELHRWGNLRTTLVPGVRFDGRGDRVITASRRGYANILSRPGEPGVAPETLASQLGLNRLSTVGELGPTDFFGDGRRAVSHTVAGSGIVVWGLDNPDQQLRFEHPAQVRSLRLSADEKCLITGADDGGLRLWDTLDGREVLQWMAHDAPVTAVAASPDASVVLSAAQDGTLRLWDFEWPSRIRELSPKRNGESRSQAELVNWYALLGQWAWSRELVESSSVAGETLNALTLARVYWLSGETDRALAHFRQARQRHEAPDYYLDACMRAASDEAVPIRSE